jgi:hypothetical protein
LSKGFGLFSNPFASNLADKKTQESTLSNIFDKKEPVNAEKSLFGDSKSLFGGEVISNSIFGGKNTSSSFFGNGSLFGGPKI